MNRITVVGVAIALVMGLKLARAHEEHNQPGAAATQETATHEHAEAASETITVTGEIVDLACYVSHGAQGEGHRECAETCIKSGLPVGIKGEDGITYVIIGEHKPLNEQLARYAAKKITLRGKPRERDGIHMISNAEIVE